MNWIELKKSLTKIKNCVFVECVVEIRENDTGEIREYETNEILGIDE